MVSIYCVLAIYSTIGALVYGMYRHQIGEEVLRLKGWGLYALSRIVPLLMLTGRSGAVWLNLALDLAVFLLLDRLTASKDRRLLGRGGILYTLNPVALLAVVSGQAGLMAAVCLSAVLLLLLERGMKRRNASFAAIEFYPEYVCLSHGMFYCLIAGERLGQQAFPALLLPMGVVAILTAVCAARKLLNRRKMTRWFRGGEFAAEAALPSGRKPTGRDLAFMAVLTAVFALAVFKDLGSLAVPETNCHLERDGTNEILLDLGRNVELDRLEIYLGYQKDRAVSVSYAPSGSSEWTLLHSKTNVKRCYEWNKLDMGVTARYVGIVSMSESADLLEIVLLNTDGERVIPLNASSYPALFDEQDRYPEYQTYFHRMIFDESHYGRTAYDVIHGQEPTEVTHPPLGKVLTGAGVWLFGMNPFGWRFMSALFGTLMVPLMYLFALRFSGRTAVAVTAAVLLCTEFMHLALSRLSTLDTIASFFILLMLYWMYRFAVGLEQGTPMRQQYPVLLLCGCAMGCAVATKFTGVYAAAGAAVLFFLHLIPYCRKRGWNREMRRELGELFLVCVGSFVAVPLAIYALSYLPFSRAYPDMTLFEIVVENTKYMLSYHAGAVFDHTYASPWYTWLLDLRPLPDAINRTREGYVSTQVTLGHPLVVFGGLAALVHQFYLWLCRKDLTARFLTIAYLSMLMPWWVIRRTVFIYHYFGCILVLVLMLAHSAQQSGRKRTLAALAVVSCLLFALFYPVLTGTEVPAAYAEMLEWFDSWAFA